MYCYNCDAKSLPRLGAEEISFANASRHDLRGKDFRKIRRTTLSGFGENCLRVIDPVWSLRLLVASLGKNV